MSTDGGTVVFNPWVRRPMASCRRSDARLRSHWASSSFFVPSACQLGIFSSMVPPTRQSRTTPGSLKADPRPEASETTTASAWGGTPTYVSPVIRSPRRSPTTTISPRVKE